jgi:superfamily I DNA/RNA helicase
VLHLGSRAWRCWVSTFAETAIELAREEADRRGVKAEFAVADASQLECLGRAFATVLDTD